LAALVGAGAVGAIRAQPSQYRLVENWAQVPAGFKWGQVADADVDAQGNLWVLHRRPSPGMPGYAEVSKRGGGETPVLMFDRTLTLVKSFGQGLFLQPHGLHVDPEGNVWVADSGPFFKEGMTPGRGFQVFKFDRDGKLLMTLGKGGVSRAGPDTFVMPTDVLVNARGEIFVSDGHQPRPDPAEGDRVGGMKLERYVKP
jgi:DNA-binding beta-propeller fold protein YncE